MRRSARSARATSCTTAFNHWPIWIFVFFIAPGPLTFDLFERGFDGRMALWLGVVLLATGIAGCAAACPAWSLRPTSSGSRKTAQPAVSARLLHVRVERRDHVRRAEHRRPGRRDRHRRVVFEADLRYAYFPIAGTVWLLGALGKLPRVKPSTKGEGHERRYFYGTVWAMCIAQPALWLMWYVLPDTRVGNSLKLAIFLGILAYVGNLARLGRLPRTRPIVPGELAVSD